MNFSNGELLSRYLWKVYSTTKTLYNATPEAMKPATWKPIMMVSLPSIWLVPTM